MSVKMLFISSNLGELNKDNGGYVCSRRNLAVMEEIYGSSNIDRIDLDPFVRTGSIRKDLIFFVKRFLCLLMGYMNGLSSKRNKEIVDHIFHENCRFVFVDNSISGSLIRDIKKRLPEVYVISFFHNIEFRYIYGSVISGSIFNIIRLPCAYFNERLTCRYSDSIITLTDLDGMELKKAYRRSADLVLPMSVPDSYNSYIRPTAIYDYLFVGSFFYANVHGLKWFIRKILPSVPGKLYIAGKGMEQLNKYSFVQKNRDRVVILGRVENLNEVYSNAKIVIAPLLLGSGMKVKVAEALMHGKTIMGTPVAFEGYKSVNNIIASTFTNKSEFMKGLAACSDNASPLFNNNSRLFFLNEYSNDVAKVRLQSFLELRGLLTTITAGQ